MFRLLADSYRYADVGAMPSLDVLTDLFVTAFAMPFQIAVKIMPPVSLIILLTEAVIA